MIFSAGRLAGKLGAAYLELFTSKVIPAFR